MFYNEIFLILSSHFTCLEKETNANKVQTLHQNRNFFHLSIFYIAHISGNANLLFSKQNAKEKKIPWIIFSISQICRNKRKRMITNNKKPVITTIIMKIDTNYRSNSI